VLREFFCAEGIGAEEASSDIAAISRRNEGLGRFRRQIQACPYFRPNEIRTSVWRGPWSHKPTGPSILPPINNQSKREGALKDDLSHQDDKAISGDKTRAAGHAAGAVEGGLGKVSGVDGSVSGPIVGLIQSIVGRH
jgi:hypothetical protein